MPVIKTGPRVVVSVVATGGGDWQVTSTPTGFQGITSALFADNDYIHGFVRFENGVDWEEYDTNDDSTTNLLQIANVTGTVTITRPATPYGSSNGGARVSDTTGTHTLAISLGSGTMERIFREINGSWKTFTSGDATPDVSDYRLFKTAGATTITAFDNMEDGKVFFVQRGASDITIADGAGISLPGDRNLTLTTNQPCAMFAEDNGVAVLVAMFPDLRRLINGVTSSELTIASGAITPTQASHTVDTEGDAASDDVDTITGTNFSAGNLLALSAASASRAVVLKHGTGNILLPDNADITLDDTEKTVILRFDGANWNYVAGSRAADRVLSGSGDPSGVVTPEYVGQIYVDTGGEIYGAFGATNTDWALLSSLSTVTVFGTVSDIQSYTGDLADQRAVLLLGYYTPGDGGGGELVHLTTDGGVYGKLTISSGGTGYNEGIQRVTLTGGNSDATAWVYVENGIVVDGWIEHPGTGYTGAASPSLSGLGGSGFSGSFALGDNGEAFLQTSYASSARRFIRRQAEAFSARQFGAYGDTIQNGSTGALTNAAGGSVHDDADALQRLMNKGRKVRLEAGTYAISTTLKYRFGTIVEGERAWTAVSPQRQITGNPRTTSPVTIVSDALSYDRNRDTTLIWNGSATSFDVDAGTGTAIAMMRASSTAIGDDGAGWSSNVSADTKAMYGVGLINVGLDCNNKADMGLCGWLCGWGSIFRNVQAWRAKWAGIFMTDLWSTTIEKCGAFYCEDNGMVFGQPYKSGAYKFFPNWGGVVNAVQFDNPRSAWNGLVGGTPGSVADGGGNSKQWATDGTNGGVSGFPNYHGHGLMFFLSRGNVVIDGQGEINDGSGILVEGPRDSDNAMANVVVGGYYENNGYHGVDESRAVFEYNCIVVCNNGFAGMAFRDVFLHPFGKCWIAGDSASFNAGTGVTLLPQDYVVLQNVKTAGLNATGTGAVTAAGLRADHKYYKLIDCDIEFHNNIVGSTVGSNGTQPDPNGGIVFNGNLLCQNNMVLARGMVTLAAGSATVTEGHNLVYSAHPSTGQIDFTFSVPARSANYTVIANMEGLDGNSQPFKANVKEGTRTVSGFSIEVRTGEASSQALNNAGGKFLHLAVYGARDNSSLVKS